LTIDLTTAVAEEALQEDSGVEAVVTYRTYIYDTSYNRSNYFPRVEGTYYGRAAAGVIIEVVC
jgi:hypothetical protein